MTVFVFSFSDTLLFQFSAFRWSFNLAACLLHSWALIVRRLAKIFYFIFAQQWQGLWAGTDAKDVPVNDGREGKDEHMK